MKSYTKAIIAILLLLAGCIAIAIMSGENPEPTYFPDHSELEWDSLHDAQVETDQRAIMDKQRQQH